MHHVNVPVVWPALWSSLFLLKNFTIPVDLVELLLAATLDKYLAGFTGKGFLFRPVMQHFYFKYFK